MAGGRSNRRPSYDESDGWTSRAADGDINNGSAGCSEAPDGEALIITMLSWQSVIGGRARGMRVGPPSLQKKKTRKAKTRAATQGCRLDPAKASLLRGSRGNKPTAPGKPTPRHSL